MTLDTELDMPVRSAAPEPEKFWPKAVPGEPSPDAPVPRLWGIFTPRPPMVGDESGDDSARVEWCRLVQAREKSRPRERRGSTEAGDP